jgi:hypothetical protein
LHITTSTGCYFVGKGTADRVVDFEGATDGAGGCAWVAEKGGEEICVLGRGLDEGKIVLNLRDTHFDCLACARPLSGQSTVRLKQTSKNPTF